MDGNKKRSKIIKEVIEITKKGLLRNQKYDLIRIRTKM